MFEREIREEVLNGIELHDREGEVYWKLMKKCGRCDTILNECLCFRDDEKMKKAKDEVFYCSSQCYYASMSPEVKEDMVKKFRNEWAHGETHLSPDEIDNYPDDDDPLFLELLYDWLDEWTENVGEIILELMGVEECPI